MMDDTTANARQAQIEAIRRLSPSERVEQAAQMSEDARRIAFDAEHRRHPELTWDEAREAVLTRLIVGALDGAGIPFMIAGSFASTTHGLPRTTQGLDVVIDPPDADALESLLRSLAPEHYYVDVDAARDALRDASTLELLL